MIRIHPPVFEWQTWDFYRALFSMRSTISAAEAIQVLERLLVLAEPVWVSRSAKTEMRASIHSGVNS